MRNKHTHLPTVELSLLREPESVLLAPLNRCSRFLLSSLKKSILSALQLLAIFCKLLMKGV